MMSSSTYLNKFSIAAALCAALLSQIGCSGGGRRMPATEPVAGTVTVGGKPVAGVEVYFVNEQLVSYGKTDDKGHYHLVQGAVAGDNKVYFTKVDASTSQFAGQEGMDEYQLQMASGSGNKKPPKPVIPPEYSDAASPKLNYVVPDGGTEQADFKL
ncbi:MAG: hypothetical protein ACTHK7_01415 [Aureliella sp.]